MTGGIPNTGSYIKMGGVNHAYTNQTATSPTVIFLTSTSLTSWTVPNDFNISANTIELIGAGGGGGVALASSTCVSVVFGLGVTLETVGFFATVFFFV